MTTLPDPDWSTYQVILDTGKFTVDQLDETQAKNELCNAIDLLQDYMDLRDSLIKIMQK